MVKRKTQAKRMVRKLKAVRQDLLHRMHAPVREQHRWLGQVLRGHYRYYGVIFNYRALRVFKDCVVRLWRKVLGKRSQKGRVSWASYKSGTIRNFVCGSGMMGGKEPNHAETQRTSYS